MTTIQAPQPNDGGRFRKKPVVIEAFQMTKERRSDNSDWPEWLNAAWNKTWPEPGAVSCEDFPTSNGTDRLVIATLEGTHLVSWGDWILQGVKGELYPCKPDIFAATYEPAAIPSPEGAPSSALEALMQIKATLVLENEKGAQSAIVDTIWHGPGETLFDYIDNSIAALAALAAQPQAALAYQQANPLGGPAKVFRAMADAIEAGDSYEATLRRYRFAEVTPSPAEGDELPPLPARLCIDDDKAWFSADQMHAYASDALAARPLAPWGKTVESAALLLNRCTQLPLDDCEGLAGTILGMAAASEVQPKKSTEPDEDLWTETQVADICGAVKNHCGPATAARLRRLIETAQAPAPVPHISEAAKRVLVGDYFEPGRDREAAMHLLDHFEKCLTKAATQAPAVAHELTDLELERLFCERVGLDSINPAAFDTRRACRWFINGYRASQNPAAQARSDALEEAVEALEPLKARWLPNVRDVYVVGECAAAIRALVAKRPAHPKQIAGIGCALCGRNEAGYYCTGDCGEYQDAAASQPPVQPQGGA